MSGLDPDGYSPDPVTGLAVAGGITAGTLAGLALTYVLNVALSSVGPWWLFAVTVAVPAVVGVVLLAIPRWRRAGAGFVMGLAIGSIVSAGVCVGFIAWITSQLG
ncbi:hypothetical protein [Ornithinimicrobium tianjinense]|uniref:Uncharacterized protein n=1 Tax=Ornithinimicrobium tianjinense TaxID=1195761 RepID=A0A917BL84_9MICO|nr:hypothetical protein [Ornithinimicrobium tianjinense]GGF46696.1 hypothetical protein GCM10011366_13020 [Ornithinimicrobium tianjinense]